MVDVIGQLAYEFLMTFELYINDQVETVECQAAKAVSFIRKYAAMAMAENKNNLSSSFMDNFSCRICLEVLYDPVQCQNNEHYYCRKCITKHLKNSETCPLCMEQLTLETLRTAPRVILEIVAQLKPRCSHVSRGCKENVQVEELLLHEQTCGYAPVVCSNEGCEETVNRRDKESHETEECKFRKITCESCDEELVYVDYEKHNCTLRKEMNEVKSRLDEITESLKQILLTQGEMLEQLAAHDQSIRNLQDPLPHASSMTFQREGTVVMNGQIFIFGGFKHETTDSIEIFNWSTKTWTLIRDCLSFPRVFSFSFLYGKKIMICGGNRTEKIEILNPKEREYTSTVTSVSLSDNARHNGLLYNGRILTFFKGVVETSLESPGKSRTLLMEKEGRRAAGVHCFGNNIYIVGGSEGSMKKYDVLKNKMKTLPSLPYKVLDMATVVYKDNIIILGGCDGNSSWSPLNDVLMYNIHSMKCTRLPSMLEKRLCCAAVIMGDVIVVMGGQNEDRVTGIRTVEYYVMGASAWQELPDMNLPRTAATACVYV